MRRRRGHVTPESGKGPTVAAAAPQKGKQGKSPESRGAPHVPQALRVIESEAKAAQYLARQEAHQAEPEELALIVSMLYGATLRGFCRVTEKALGVQHA